MMPSIPGIIVGALAGLVVTTVITMIWPKGTLRWLRPLATPLIGLAVAYALMRLI